MSANLFNNSFASYRQPAWHNLGIVFEERLDLVEAFKLAKLDYNCYSTEIYIPHDGEYLDTSNYRAIVREAVENNPAVVLGITSDHYRLFQNMELARILNPISDYFPVETAGALGNGEQIFAAMDAGEFEFMGELYHGFFTVLEDKRAKGAIKIYFTPVRAVCQNTIILGLRQTIISINIRHSRDAGIYLNNITGIIETMHNSQSFVTSLFGDLAKTRFSLDDFVEMVKTIYAQPKKTGKADKIELDFGDKPEEEMIDISEAGALALDLFKRFNDEQPQFGNTAYAALQAVYEDLDYRPPLRGPQNIQQSALFGSRAMIKNKVATYLMKRI
jgi:phage/plasmid-like protein (TIGR03299 family)